MDTRRSGGWGGRGDTHALVEGLPLADEDGVALDEVRVQRLGDGEDDVSVRGKTCQRCGPRSTYRDGGGEKTLSAGTLTSPCYELNPWPVAVSQDVLPGLGRTR